MMSDDDILEFNFEGVEPATGSGWAAMPKGEYNLQCVGAEKFYAKAKNGPNKGQPDPNRPGLRFNFVVTDHPVFTGTERSIWHVFPAADKPDDWKYILNTLMCLIPEFDWQKNGIKIPMSALFQQVQNRPVNGMISWEVNVKDGKKYVNNSLDGLRKYDPSITQPVATENNPPVFDNSSVSPAAQQAAAGVPASEVQSFLDSAWPGATAPAASGSADFGMEPF
jgi:hypothetical protein